MLSKNGWAVPLVPVLYDLIRNSIYHHTKLLQLPIRHCTTTHIHRRTSSFTTQTATHRDIALITTNAFERHASTSDCPKQTYKSRDIIGITLRTATLQISENFRKIWSPLQTKLVLTMHNMKVIARVIKVSIAEGPHPLRQRMGSHP